MKTKSETAGITRRQFLAASALAGAAVVAGCQSPGNDSWEFLSPEQARCLAAICDEIIPADDFPAASQAGVVTYIDRQLMRHYSRHQTSYIRGLRQADACSISRCGRCLADLLPQQRLALVTAIEHEDPEFFELVRRHTMEGYYGSPRHGGNRDAVSWRMLGLAEPPGRGRAQYDFTKSARS